MYTFICEDSIDGIFTGIYDASASKYGHRNITLTCEKLSNYELFHEYIIVTPDSEKSQKVGSTIMERFGFETFQYICQAILAVVPIKKHALDKADCVYRTIILAFSMYDGSRVLQALGEPYVQRVFELSRATNNEAHHLLGFLRFSELENGILFASIHPKNDVLTILGDHFTDRLPVENFIIYDENRQTAAIHKASKSFLIVDASDLNQDIIKRYSSKELEYRKLWCGFFESIAIEARANSKLQSQNIPKRFWKDTVELGSQTTSSSPA